MGLGFSFLIIEVCIVFEMVSLLPRPQTSCDGSLTGLSDLVSGNPEARGVGVA